MLLELLLISGMAVLTVCGEALAYEAFTGAHEEQRLYSGPIVRAKVSNDSYEQKAYTYGSGRGSIMDGPEIGWRGEYYYLMKNADHTRSYIYQNLLDVDSEEPITPFIIIDGNVSSFKVTSDAASSYVYYSLEDNDYTIYRLPLRSGATDAEKEERIFSSFEGTAFAFSSFTLAEEPGQFLLCSKLGGSDGLDVTIGLFNYDEGSEEPIRTWDVTLPQEWEDNFEQLSTVNNGYEVVFESSTHKVWLVAERTFRWSGSKGNYFYWFFSGDIESPGPLISYDPASSIPGWNDGNLKLLHIGRFGRIVHEFNGSNPDVSNILSVKQIDAATNAFKIGAITSWVDTNNGNVQKSLADFYSLSFTSDLRYFDLDFPEIVDGNGNMYLSCSIRTKTGVSSSGNQQRVVLFSPTEEVIPAPAPSPSADGGSVFPPGNVVLASLPVVLPTGYSITGSTWEIFDADTEELAYSASPNGSSFTHTVTDTAIPDGDYVWHVAYDWTKSATGSGVPVYGSTKWSEYADITIAEPPTGTAPSITTHDLPGGEVGKPYYAELTATGSEPITWSIIGDLPTGLELVGSVITGNPTAAGGYSFTVVASNSSVYADSRLLGIEIADGYRDNDDGGGGCDAGAMGLAALAFAVTVSMTRKRG
jgi:hypothetical protein